MLIKNKVIEKLKTCFDPEIPIDLWNLGLIYDVKTEKIEGNQFNIEILMTLTTPGCSMIEIIAADVKEKIISIENVKDVNVKITFEPLWEPTFMTDEAKSKLGFTKPKTNNEDTDWE